eukprot:8116031-Pyramimonas_sp.AAC.1
MDATRAEADALFAEIDARHATEAGDVAEIDTCHATEAGECAIAVWVRQAQRRARAVRRVVFVWVACAREELVKCAG